MGREPGCATWEGEKENGLGCEFFVRGYRFFRGLRDGDRTAFFGHRKLSLYNLMGCYAVLVEF